MAATYLAPVERPKGLIMKLAYYFTRRKFGKVFGPLSVFCARMPLAFTFFYGKVSSLDKKLLLPRDLAVLIREQVASVNGCLFCMDATRYYALKASLNNQAKFDALVQYRTSSQFSEAERAALDYATELTQRRKSVPRRLPAWPSSIPNERSATLSGWLRANISTTSTTLASTSVQMACAKSAKCRGLKSQHEKHRRHTSQPQCSWFQSPRSW